MTRILPLTFLLTAACAHKGSYEVAEGTGGGADSTLSEADALWEERGDTEQLKASLAKYEEVYNTDPSNRHALVRLTRGWYFLGDGHMTEMEEKMAAWDTSINWGKKCLALNTEFTTLLEKGNEKEETAVRAATEDDVPCLYWTATSLGKWAKASGLGKTLKNLPTVKAYQTRVSELNPDYWYAGPDRYWGAYYAGIPSFAGQDLNKSREHFDASLAAYNDYLGTHVLLAEFWAIKSQDRATFEEQLNWVLAQDPTVIPEITAENEAEQRKAQALLDAINEHFLE